LLPFFLISSLFLIKIILLIIIVDLVGFQ
jgi:hypothetical protein